MILELCKSVHCVHPGESFQTHIYLQNLASIQPRTSPVKFARSLAVQRARGRVAGGCWRGLRGARVVEAVGEDVDQVRQEPGERRF